MSGEQIQNLQSITKTSSNSGQCIKLFKNLKIILELETQKLDNITSSIKYEQNYDDNNNNIDRTKTLEVNEKNQVKELLEIIKEMESSQSKTEKEYLKAIFGVVSYFQITTDKNEKNEILTYIDNIIKENNNEDNWDQKFPFKEVKQVILNLFGELQGNNQNQFQKAIDKLTPDEAEHNFFDKDDSASYLANELNEYVKNQKEQAEPENNSKESEDEKKKAIKLYCYLKNFHLLVKKDELERFQQVYKAIIEKKEIEGNPDVEKAKKNFQEAVEEFRKDPKNVVPKQFDTIEILSVNDNLPEADQKLIEERNKLIVTIRLACNCKVVKQEMSESIQSLKEKLLTTGGSLKTKRTIPKKRRVKQRKGCFKSTKKRRAKKKKSFLYK